MRATGSVPPRGDRTGLVRLFRNRRYERRFEMIEQLIAEGASLEIRDERGQTPLSCLIMSGNIQRAKLLIELGANVNYLGYDDGHIWTEIAYYWEDGYLDLAEFSLNHGGRLDFEDFYGLHAASQNGLYEYTKWLLEHGADPWKKDSFGNLPIDVAYMYSYSADNTADPEELETTNRIEELLLEYK